MAFSGYLIKLGGAGGTTLPLKYMRYETYKAAPNQRFDLNSTRDTTGLLHRTALAHTATKIEFETPYMTNSDINTLMTMIRSHWVSVNERKIVLQYYDSETDSYKTGNFYMPDINFDIRNIDLTKNIINYQQIRFAFIEY